MDERIIRPRYFDEGLAMSKRTMTLNLTDAEMAALESLCLKKDLNKTSVMRQALRLYQFVDQRVERGEKLFVEDEAKSSKAELVMI